MTSPAAPLLEYLLQPLAEWLNNSATEDIAINEPGKAWIRHHGAWERVEVPLGLDAIEEIAILAGSLRKQEVGNDSPLLDTEMPNGERLAVCLPPTVPVGFPSLTFRKHEDTISPTEAMTKRYVIGQWNKRSDRQRQRSLTEPMSYYSSGDLQGFLRAAVRRHLNILLVGPTGSGKTTFSKTLISEIDHSERLIVIEDTLELALHQPNVVRLLYSKGGLSGLNIGPERLLQMSLRMRPTRILLQELRDEAAFIFVLIAAAHPGTITTIHGNSSGDGLRRLLALSGQASPTNNDETLITLIDAAVDVVIPLHEYAGTFEIGEIWFIGEALQRGQTAAELLRAA
jgi:type IV secretion system protein VirB11